MKALIFGLVALVSGCGTTPVNYLAKAPSKLVVCVPGVIEGTEGTIVDNLKMGDSVRVFGTYEVDGETRYVVPGSYPHSYGAQNIYLPVSIKTGAVSSTSTFIQNNHAIPTFNWHLKPTPVMLKEAC